jgi:hypothetical protein
VSEATAAPPGLDPGWHPDLPMAAYLAMDAMSASQLESFRRSPLHWKHERDNPREGTSAAMEKGTALHLALLEPDLFRSLVHEDIPGDGRTKAVREARSALRESLTEDSIVLPPADYLDVLGMRDSVLAHPRARTFFRGEFETEVTAIWEEPTTGITCRARFDVRVPRAPIVPDLKTCRNAQPWAFGKDAADRGYHRKMAWYRRAERALGRDVEDCAIIAVENTAPYATAVYLLKPEDVDAADREITQLLDRFAYCRDNDFWPGYGDEFLTLRLPNYATQETSDV